GGLARSIAGHAQSAKTRDTALRLRLGESVYATAAEEGNGADLIVLCAPVGVCGTLAQQMASSMRPGAIVTDVGSVKGAIVREVGPHLPQRVCVISGAPV